MPSPAQQQIEGDTVRLNRKWLYLGGLVTILTLLLTLTWALPAGAVGTLDDGELSADKDFVSTVSTGTDAPSTMDRTVEVTLTNADLDSTMSVRNNGDFDAVTIAGTATVLTDASITVNITAGGAGNPSTVSVTRPSRNGTVVAADAVLPIIGSVTVDTSQGATSPATARKVGTPEVINPTLGIVRIPLRADLEAADTIHLAYNTSNQETALVNVRGDRGNFDLLLVESPTKPGEYSGSFVVKDLPDVTMTTASAVVDEQHSIDSGLQGYREFRNETITEFFNTYTAATGTLSNTEANESSTTRYARVANPPIRDGRNDDDTINGADISVSGLPNNVTIAEGTVVNNANQGILLFTASAAEDFDDLDNIDVDYFGSDTFEITVDNGPLRLGDTLDTQNTSAGLDTLGAVDSNTNIKIVLPTTEQDKNIDHADILASNNLAIVSVTDGTDCKQCVIRLGVITGGQAENESDGDPAPLTERFSVLAISYFGSERIDIPDGIANIDVDGDGANDGTDDQNPRLFRVLLDAAPANVGTGTDFEHDITVVASSHTAIAAPTDVLSGITTDISIALDAENNQRISGREVWFSIDPDAVGSVGDDGTDDDYFDVTYTRQVGALPANALDPDQDAGETSRVIAVGPGSRVRITSGNDAVDVDAEKDGPRYGNAMPSGSTGSTSATISIDVTDDLAGVKKGEIELMVKAGSRRHWTVVNRDLDITEIEGGYRATIDLDDVRDNGGGNRLRVEADETTKISWYATAEDEAGNVSRSDSDGDEDGDQDYTFNVDGESPELERAYTGDWFDIAEGDKGRVKGDRRVSSGNYLPGKASNTSVRVVFSEALDGSSVSADDFTVDGAVPSAAQTWSEGLTHGVNEDGMDEEDRTNGVIGRSVFLTVSAMDADETPQVELVGSVTDKAGNAVSSGSKIASDGIAPTATLSVDTMLSQKTVTITVTTDEGIRIQYPELSFFISDGLDRGEDELDEKDTFTVGLEDPKSDPGSGNPLVLRDSADEIVFSGDLDKAGELPLTLSKAPILDRSTAERDGVVDGGDISVTVMADDTALAQATANRKIEEAANDKAIVDAEAGKILLMIVGPLAAVADDDQTTEDESMPMVPALKDGDRIVVTYRGTGPDSADDLGGVPSNPVGSREPGENAWNYKLNFSRNDRFAVTAQVEDVNRNKSTGGVGDPTGSGATVFEIDSNLAGLGVADADSTPADDPAGAHPVGFDDPFTIDLSWPAEEGEYPGDSHPDVKLTKLELDGVDVMANAAKQDANSYSIDIEDISLGAHTLTYNAEDAAGNAYPKDRTLKFTVKERPTWDLNLRKGMNLISLPSSPSDGSIDAVFGGSSEVDLVFTFEGGRSLVAVRNPGTGGFAGTLTNIDTRHAYWVSATNATTVEITIPPTSAFQPLPNIPVMGGAWNLVPVLSLGAIDSKVAGEGAAPGTLMDADAYLGDFQIAFGWEGGRWKRIDPDPADASGTAEDEKRLVNDIRTAQGKTAADEGDDPLKVGMGYWVLYSQDSFIVPR